MHEGGLPCQELTEVAACPRRPRCEVQCPQEGGLPCQELTEVAACPRRPRCGVQCPQEGGLPCQELTEVAACPRRPRCEVQYRPSNNRYRLGRWTDCAAFHPSQAKVSVRLGLELKSGQLR